MQKTLAAMLAGTAFLVTGAARAQAPGTTFSNGGTFVLSAERLAGLSFTDTTVKSQDGTQENQRTTTELSLGTRLFAYSLNPFVQTQLGFDYFVIDRLSIGAGLAYWQGSGEDEQTGDPSEDLDDLALFRLTPRVGYGMMFNDVLGLWARGGVGYYSFSGDDPDGSDVSDHGWAFSAEGLLVISPLDHFAIHLGPAIDIGFGGEREVDPADPDDPNVTNDTSHKHYGLVVGVSGWF